MNPLKVRLLGKFSVQRSDHELIGLDGAKVQELLAYLLIHRNRPHPRELLAGLLWGERSTAQAKKYLRQAIWQLQAALTPRADRIGSTLLLTDSDWVRYNLDFKLWLDVEVFERTFSLVEGVPGSTLDREEAQGVRDAIQLYRGQLLDGWYQEWCLTERERLHFAYLAMVDKLIGYCQANAQYESGIMWGAAILAYDRARERTHRQLMRLYCLARDRTGALRQYERCVAALKEELDVEPSQTTMALYEQIRADRFDGSSGTPAGAIEAPSPASQRFVELVARLRQFGAMLAETQRHLEEEVNVMETILKNPT